MLPDEIECLAARHVPGKGPLDIQRLRDGLVNETYRVLRDGATYALRVAAPHPCDLGLDRAWEARVLEHAVAADLAPALQYCDPPRGILISRWVDGRMWTPADVRHPPNIARMARLARRIHALPMPTPARLMSPATWIDYYSAAVGKIAVRDAGSVVTLRTAAALRTAAVSRLAELAVIPSVDPVVCHSDLHTFNLIDRGHSLVLLDWEYAHASDPLWDLASWSANNDLPNELRLELLASYAGRPPTGDEIQRLQLLAWLYDYVCLLWSELYLNLQRGPRPTAAALQTGNGEGACAREAQYEAGAHEESVESVREGVLARARLLAARLMHPSSRAE
jgi:thiamine kinase